MTGDILAVFGGLILLAGAGEFLVRGAVNLALRLGIPALVVGLTVVAFGTSAPELLVSVSAVLDGVPALALGNVVGSNIANILIVLGIPALISVMHASRVDTTESYLMMLGATTLFLALAFVGVFTWLSGLVLLAALGLMLWRSYQHAARHRAANGNGGNGQPQADLPDREGAEPAGAAEVDLEGADSGMPFWKVGLFLCIGMVGLPLGAELLVHGAVNIARVMGLSEAVIGLTLVALGTSLPELATTVAAALRKSADVALGNVIGSNMFNLLAIIGVASLTGPIPVSPDFLRFDLWVMAGASLLLLPIVLRQLDFGARTGAFFVAGYAGYVVALLG